MLSLNQLPMMTISQTFQISSNHWYEKIDDIKLGEKIMTTNILLCCNEGMSTSFLVNKMQKVAADNKLDVKIWAVAEPRVDTESDTADVVLLGPQLAFLEDKITERIGEKVPVKAISAEDFGRVNAPAVLKQALNLVRERRAQQ